MEAPITVLPSLAHLAEITWLHPTGIWNPQPAFCSWAGPQGPPQHDVTAHMFWLLAASAPIKQRGELRPLALAGPNCMFTWTTPAQTSILRYHLLQEGCLDAPRLVGIAYRRPQLPGLPPSQPSPHCLVTQLSLLFPSSFSRFGDCSPAVGSGEERGGRKYGAHCHCVHMA